MFKKVMSFLILQSVISCLRKIVANDHNICQVFSFIGYFQTYWKSLYEVKLKSDGSKNDGEPGRDTYRLTTRYCCMEDCLCYKLNASPHTHKLSHCLILNSVVCDHTSCLWLLELHAKLCRL